ncbi:unnamed protein product [Absidia cylindrospora]
MININAAKAELISHQRASKSLDNELKQIGESSATGGGDQVNEEKSAVSNEHDDYEEESDDEPASSLNDEGIIVKDESKDDYIRMNEALDKIKKVSQQLHDRFLQPNSKLSPTKRNLMCLGLSSIIDFVDQDPKGQRSLLNKWTGIIYDHSMNNILALKTLKYPPLCKMFGIGSLRLSILDRHSILLDPLNLSDCAEYDIAFKIWLPLFDSLFGGRSRIATKISETTNPYSSRMKHQQYSEANQVISFKIDFRIILHHHHDEHHKGVDLAAGEAARNINESKIKMDHGKLARETKDVLDRLLLLTVDENLLSSPWKGIAIQVSGLQGQISSVHLHDSGLYVLCPISRLFFPHSHASLSRFLPTLKTLLQLRIELETMATKVLGQLDLAKDKRYSLGTTFGRPGSPIPESPTKKLKKPTWYSPPPHP